MSKSLVLNPKRNAAFRRGSLTFNPGQIVEVSDTQLWSIRSDVGNAIVAAYVDESGRTRVFQGDVKIVKPVKRRKSPAKSVKGDK